MKIYRQQKRSDPSRDIFPEKLKFSGQLYTYQWCMYIWVNEQSRIIFHIEKGPLITGFVSKAWFIQFICRKPKTYGSYFLKTTLIWKNITFWSL